MHVRACVRSLQMLSWHAERTVCINATEGALGLKAGQCIWMRCWINQLHRAEHQRRSLRISVTTGTDFCCEPRHWNESPALLCFPWFLFCLSGVLEWNESLSVGMWVTPLPFHRQPAASVLRSGWDGLLHHCHQVPRLGAKATNKDKKHTSLSSKHFCSVWPLETAGCYHVCVCRCASYDEPQAKVDHDKNHPESLTKSLNLKNIKQYKTWFEGQN